MYFLSLQLIDNQEYVFVKLTFSSGLKIQVSQVFKEKKAWLSDRRTKSISVENPCLQIGIHSVAAH